MRIGATGIVLAAAVLAGCKNDAKGGAKDSGPSSGDLSVFFEEPVERISCAKAAESVYRCRFKFKNAFSSKFKHAEPRGEQVQCFVTDGSTWDIKLWC